LIRRQQMDQLQGASLLGALLSLMRVLPREKSYSSHNPSQKIHR
jgi:hypothetical protein